ncbi:hypothetical protein KM043_012125 [Ampulex compressa]|nr:hypothetical protein KM043_012125 [Ampulex compressa]
MEPRTCTRTPHENGKTAFAFGKKPKPLASSKQAVRPNTPPQFAIQNRKFRFDFRNPRREFSTQETEQAVLTFSVPPSRCYARFHTRRWGLSSGRFRNTRTRSSSTFKAGSYRVTIKVRTYYSPRRAIREIGHARSGGAYEETRAINSGKARGGEEGGGRANEFKYLDCGGLIDGGAALEGGRLRSRRVEWTAEAGPRNRPVRSEKGGSEERNGKRRPGGKRGGRPG